MKAKLHHLLFVFLLFAGVRRISAQSVFPTLIQQQELTAADGGAGDQFAWPVALSADGNTALIGAERKIINGNISQGAAYVFTRSGSNWVLQQELTAADGTASDFFGSPVKLSADGNTALIGAGDKKIGSNSGQGAAYVFVRSGSTWTQEQELTASDGAAGDLFAAYAALSADGSNALVTAFTKNVGSNPSQGAAYVFTRSGSAWAQQQELTASDAAANDLFGESPAVSGDGGTILIGSPGKHAEYVFVRSGSTWTQRQELTASDGTASDEFGFSAAALSADGNTALIGADGKSVGTNSDQGAAYVFVRSGSNWVQQQEFTASDGAADDEFGVVAALSPDGSTALIGDVSKDVGTNSRQGAAYLFTRSGSNWVQQQELTAADGAGGDRFGSTALSADGSTVLVGAQGKNFGQGAAYVFVVQTGVPNLLIAPNGSNSVKVLWPNTGSYTLLESSNLAPGSWTTNSQTITTNNGTNSVIITPAVGNLFFRLSQP